MPVRRAIWIFPLLLAACGGGERSPLPDTQGPSVSQFTSDRPGYFIGEQAQLVAVFAGGTGRIEPGDIVISSGQTITTPPLSTSTTYRLIVTGTDTVTRDLMLPVSYRERMRAIPMPFARARHAAVALNDGRVLIIGGLEESHLVARPMYVFDPSSEAFTQFGSLIAGRALFEAVTLADGNVLVTGGVSGAPDAVVVNAQTGAAIPTANQPHTVRVAGTAIRLPDNKVLFVGGLVSTGAVVGASDRSAEIYDPATGTFTVLPASLSVGRYGHTAVATNDGRVLIYGGLTDNGQAAPPELYDPASGSFTVLMAPEGHARANHTAVRAIDGSIWIIGGDDNSTIALTSVIRFDPITSVFNHALDLATPRSSPGAAVLTDSRLLITGGATDLAQRQATDTSELIVTNTALRGAGPQMLAARYGHTMTLLSNGKVLIVGGFDQSGDPVASAEIYE